MTPFPLDTATIGSLISCPSSIQVSLTLFEPAPDVMPSPRSMILVFEIKGAIQRVAKDAMAFDHRRENLRSRSSRNGRTQPMIQRTCVGRATFGLRRSFVSPAVYADRLTR